MIRLSPVTSVVRPASNPEKPVGSQNPLLKKEIPKTSQNSPDIDLPFFSLDAAASKKSEKSTKERRMSAFVRPSTKEEEGKIFLVQINAGKVAQVAAGVMESS